MVEMFPRERGACGEPIVHTSRSLDVKGAVLRAERTLISVASTVSKLPTFETETPGGRRSRRKLLRIKKIGRGERI